MSFACIVYLPATKIAGRYTPITYTYSRPTYIYTHSYSYTITNFTFPALLGYCTLTYCKDQLQSPGEWSHCLF